MNYIDAITQYHSDLPQEIRDQEVMLEYIHQFENLLSRENHFAHMSASGFIVNPTFDKVLMVYHSIYQSWTWTGGHCDDESDILKVAIKEAKEETGIKNVTCILNQLLSLEILPVWGHVKNKEYVSSHLHLNCTLLLQCDEDEILTAKEDENEGVKWVDLNQIEFECSEKEMMPTFHKIIERIKKLQK